MSDKYVNELEEIIPTATDYVLLVRDGIWYRAKVSNIANGGTQKLPAPASFNAEYVNPTTLYLTWSNVSGNSGYVVERSTNNATWVNAGTVMQNDTDLNVSGLTSNTLYYFRIKSLGNNGLYLDSDWKTIQVTL